MHRPLSRFASRFLVALAALTCASAVFAQDYPSKPLRMLVGFPPGRGVDIVARLMATEMQKTLGQPITVEIRSGAAGNIATEAAARATPDGYTLLMGNTGSLSINPALYPKLAFDVQRDLQPVSMVSTSPLVVLVHPSNPARSLKGPGYHRQAGQGPDRFRHGRGRQCGASRLRTVQGPSRRGHGPRPYRGGSPAVTDLIAGQLQVVIEAYPLAAPFLRATACAHWP